jgi:hypothetical protein
MERDGHEQVGAHPDPAPAQPKSRFTSQFVITSPSKRKSLFSLPTRPKDVPRPASSDGDSDTRPGHMTESKIPRPPQQRISLAEAYRIAEEEEVAHQGSPSPAPRSWRSLRRPGSGAQTTANPNSVDTNSGNSPDDGSLSSQQSDMSDSTFDEKLRQHALETTGTDSSSRRNGLFSKSKIGAKIVETGIGLVRKTSRGNMDSTPFVQTGKTGPSGTWFSRRLSSRKRESGTSTPSRRSGDSAQGALNPHHDLHHGTALSGAETPNKGFAWQTDAEFTPSDLQASSSPPVAIGRSNTKIDEIRAREVELHSHHPVDNLAQTTRNTRLEDIRTLEAMISSTDDRQSGVPNSSPVPDGQSQAELSHSMAESRTREIERLSKGILAAATSDAHRNDQAGNEIHIPLFDMASKENRGRSQKSSFLGMRLRRIESEVQSSLPVQTITVSQEALAHTCRDEDPFLKNQAGEIKHGHVLETQNIHGDSLPSQDAGEDSGHLTTATKGTLEAELHAEEATGIPTSLQRTAEATVGQTELLGGTKNDVSSIAGFAPFRRRLSSESRLSKRASFVHSDSDPIERIEGEMKLFAPQDTLSERGSLRAPSPELEADRVVEETPKPVKVDPLTQPTPRITGAYVETPVAVKVEKTDDNASTDFNSNHNGVTDPLLNRDKQCSTDDDANKAGPLILRSRRETLTDNKKKRTKSVGAERPLSRSSSLPARRRARSLSRNRRPLINSANPPTVKDDLLEIQRANQIEDSTSTYDDIEDLLRRDSDLDTKLSSRKRDIDRSSIDTKPDRQRELEVFDRLNRSLKSGLLGIRTARQGIERLEGKVLQADINGTVSTPHGESGEIATDSSCSLCHGKQPTIQEPITYVHFPLPLLWRRRPKFRFTVLGFVVFLFTLWYIAESLTCQRYCKPQYCYPGSPCSWSPDDPTWGYAIPVKLDQWVAGGYGRNLISRLKPQVSDWVADLWDAATGTDITTVDTSRYTWEQKRQHRRRLAKKGLIKPYVERRGDRAVFITKDSKSTHEDTDETAEDPGFETGAARVLNPGEGM